MVIVRLAALKVIIASIFTLAGSGALYQYIGTKLDEQKYPPIGTMVDVGGYKLHMIETQPTHKASAGAAGQDKSGLVIVLEAGAGACSLNWGLVQPEIAKFAHVISYDRAGHGWSDASPLPRTSENIVKELYTMLHNANIAGPYILVGHSFGGFNAQLFAAKYSDEVAGVVLVDALNEKDFQKDAPWANMSFYENSKNYVIQSKKIMESYFGIKRLMSDLGVHKIKNLRLPTKFVRTDLDERSHFVDDAEQLRQAGQSLGDKPLTVISAGKPWPGAGNDDLNSVWPQLQADLVTKSSRGKQIIAEKSGHRIDVEQPDIIVEAVREMVNEIRNAKD
ncbi:alpha/beta hydrolase [Candidatus Babeliales bacterium]|nr:alpha/beta hydrolase [Candidatus Babeliales bacterium]MBP9843509.1 alpha/beta hydrolase [Candidatus Babeliales bacterium]